MNSPEAELEELRSQLEVIMMSVKLLGKIASITEDMAAGNARIALDPRVEDVALRLAYAQSAISWWEK